MEYNIDILVAGCNTTCMHCYVNGGKAPAMKLEDFEYCIDKLKPVLAHFGNRIGFTLDNEIYNHSEAKALLEIVERECSESYYHHGSTTGIAILKQPDRAEILNVLKRNGWKDVSFAIHGGKEKHNKIVNNSEGMDAIMEASKLFKDNGFAVNISLMISKAFLEDLSELSELMEKLSYDYVLPVIPDFYPTPRLIKYQDIRCNAGEYDNVLTFLKEKNIDRREVEKAVGLYSEDAVLGRLEVDEVKTDLFEKETAFFHIDYKLDFYVGNTGAPLKYCGNLKECSSDDIIDWIVNSKDNFYETATVHYEDVLRAVVENDLQLSKENYVYPNRISAIIAMMQNRK